MTKNVYLKKAEKTAQSDAADVRQTVQTILDEIERGGDEAARHYAAKFDQYDGNAVLTRDEIAAAAAKVPQRLKDDIAFAHDNVRRFAEAQQVARRFPQSSEAADLQRSVEFFVGQCRALGVAAANAGGLGVIEAKRLLGYAKDLGCPKAAEKLEQIAGWPRY